MDTGEGDDDNWRPRPSSCSKGSRASSDERGNSSSWSLSADVRAYKRGATRKDRLSLLRVTSPPTGTGRGRGAMSSQMTVARGTTDSETVATVARQEKNEGGMLGLSTCPPSSTRALLLDRRRARTMQPGVIITLLQSPLIFNLNTGTLWHTLWIGWS